MRGLIKISFMPRQNHRGPSLGQAVGAGQTYGTCRPMDPSHPVVKQAHRNPLLHSIGQCRMGDVGVMNGAPAAMLARVAVDLG